MEGQITEYKVYLSRELGYPLVGRVAQIKCTLSDGSGKSGTPHSGKSGTSRRRAKS